MLLIIQMIIIHRHNCFLTNLFFLSYFITSLARRGKRIYALFIYENYQRNLIGVNFNVLPDELMSEHLRGREFAVRRRENFFSIFILDDFLSCLGRRVSHGPVCNFHPILRYLAESSRVTKNLPDARHYIVRERLGNLLNKSTTTHQQTAEQLR